MKRILTLLVSGFSSLYVFGQHDTTELLTPVEVQAILASDNTPVVKTNFTRQSIAQKNNGQDLPFILQSTPGLVAFSDAGNGIGYTGLRLRGSDASRINFTINGIPYNDAESQGTFLVNIPDIASSAGSIQVQRGVGTSSQGTGAFGGGIHISTNEIIPVQSFSLQNTVGSYGSLKNTFQYNSGIIKNHFLADVRLSHIKSDGYVDRASTKLGSMYAGLVWMNAKNSVRFNYIHGKEKTYQAWNGIDAETLKNDRTYNSSGTDKPGKPYDNETDNYRQTHYQLFYNRTINKNWKSNLTLFLTRGKGYYEQYKADEFLDDYGIYGVIFNNLPITETDLIRRLYLDNYFGGAVFSLQHKNPKRDVIVGGGFNYYDGKHYGIVTNLITPSEKIHHQWYYNTAYKNEASVYGKWTENLKNGWHTYADLQLRKVNYTIHGFRNAPTVHQQNDYLFLNPKAGISYRYNKHKWYASIAKGTKEPNRDDFEAEENQTPSPEKMYDFEVGYEHIAKKSRLSANLFYMHYIDQLVLTGKINDVGAYTRTNIPVSYRMGIELEGRFQLHSNIYATVNLSFSNHKIKNFTEYIDDYDNGGQIINHYSKTDIAFSPNTTGMWMLRYQPAKSWGIELSGKYVGDQYLDNTSNDGRKLDAYYTQDIKLDYETSFGFVKSLKAFVQVQNVFSTLYEPNGYTFSYQYNQQLTTENYYFPMAPAQFFAGLLLNF